MPKGEDGRLRAPEASYLRREIERQWRNVNRFANMNDYDPSYLNRLLGSKNEPGSKKGTGIGLGQLRSLCDKAGVHLWRVFAPEDLRPEPVLPQTPAGIAAEMRRLIERLEVVTGPEAVTDFPTPQADLTESQFAQSVTSVVLPPAAEADSKSPSAGDGQAGAAPLRRLLSANRQTRRRGK